MPNELSPDELVATSGERATLDAFLDLYRDEVVRKLSGLSDAESRRRLVPSLTTVGGVVKHLRWVEVSSDRGDRTACRAHGHLARTDRRTRGLSRSKTVPVTRRG